MQPSVSIRDANRDLGCGLHVFPNRGFLSSGTKVRSLGSGEGVSPESRSAHFDNAGWTPRIVEDRNPLFLWETVFPCLGTGRWFLPNKNPPSGNWTGGSEGGPPAAIISPRWGSGI